MQFNSEKKVCQGSPLDTRKNQELGKKLIVKHLKCGILNILKGDTYGASSSKMHRMWCSNSSRGH